MKKKNSIVDFRGFIFILMLIGCWEMALAANPIRIIASDDDGHLPENTMDGDLGGKSRWSAKGQGQWIRYDFGHSQSLETISIAFFRGNKRRTSIQIQTSEDADTWVTYVDTESSGDTKNFEDFFLGGVSARYFRIVGFGNNQNDWISITEVEFIESNLTSNNSDFNDESNGVTATASDYDERSSGRYSASKAVDNNLDPKSRWSAQGDGQWLQLDLGKTKSVDGIVIAFYKGNRRTANFTIQTSLDGATWVNQLENQLSSGTTLDRESFIFPGVHARYVRFLGHGNSKSDWNSIVEISVLVGRKIAMLPPTSVEPIEDPVEDERDPLDDPVTANFDLTKWKLTLPVSQQYFYGSGSQSTAEILPFEKNSSGVKPLDQGFNDERFFFIDRNNILVFRTPLNGSGATTINSSYARTELRELYDWTPGQSSGSANWPNEGSHKLEARLKVVKYWATDPQTVVGQIHAKKSKKALVKLQWDGPNKPVRAIINKDPKSGKPFSLNFGVVGTEEFNYELSLYDDILSVTVNGLTQIVIFGQQGMSLSWDKHVFYFKAGNYPQADKKGGGLFEVHFSNLKIEHKK